MSLPKNWTAKQRSDYMKSLRAKVKNPQDFSTMPKDKLSKIGREAANKRWHNEKIPNEPAQENPAGETQS